MEDKWEVEMIRRWRLIIAVGMFISAAYAGEFDLSSMDFKEIVISVRAKEVTESPRNKLFDSITVIGDYVGIFATRIDLGEDGVGERIHGIFRSGKTTYLGSAIFAIGVPLSLMGTELRNVLNSATP